MKLGRPRGSHRKNIEAALPDAEKLKIILELAGEPYVATSHSITLERARIAISEAGDIIAYTPLALHDENGTALLRRPGA